MQNQSAVQLLNVTHSYHLTLFRDINSFSCSYSRKLKMEQTKLLPVNASFNSYEVRKRALH